MPQRGQTVTTSTASKILRPKNSIGSLSDTTVTAIPQDSLSLTLILDTRALSAFNCERLRLTQRHFEEKNPKAIAVE